MIARTGRTIVAALGLTSEDLTVLIARGRGGISFSSCNVPSGSRFVSAFYDPATDSVSTLFYAECAAADLQTETRHLLLVPLQHPFDLDGRQAVTPLCALVVGPTIFTLFEVTTHAESDTN